MFQSPVELAYGWVVAHKAYVELFGLTMTVVGLVNALRSMRSGRKLTEDLRSIFDHLTTKHLGPYPQYMGDVERIVSEARESIYIACELPAHGVWADRGRYGSYLRAIENRKAELLRKGRTLDVQLLTLDGEGRAHALQTRLPEQGWKDFIRNSGGGGWSKSKRIYEELENTKVPDTRSGFLTEMTNRQNRALDADFRFAQRWETGGMLPIYLWIVDGEKAIFAIPGFGTEPTEYGFYTEELGLMQALTSMWARYIERAQKGQDLAEPTPLRAAK